MRLWRSGQEIENTRRDKMNDTSLRHRAEWREGGEEEDTKKDRMLEASRGIPAGTEYSRRGEAKDKKREVEHQERFRKPDKTENTSQQREHWAKRKTREEVESLMQEERS